MVAVEDGWFGSKLNWIELEFSCDFGEASYSICADRVNVNELWPVVKHDSKTGLVGAYASVELDSCNRWLI